MRLLHALLLGMGLVLCGCTTTKQFAATDFNPPSSNYRMVVVRPDVSVGVLTAGGVFEPREDWTTAARDHLLSAIRAQTTNRGSSTQVLSTLQEAGADADLLVDLSRLHTTVGEAIKLHKYTAGFELPSKKDQFDWTLGRGAVEYGQASGYDYALFFHARDSFSSGGRVALQAVSMLGCVFGACFVPQGGIQQSFASLVDLKTGNVVWFNHVTSEVGDIRGKEGADALVEKLLAGMHGSPQNSSTGRK